MNPLLNSSLTLENMLYGLTVMIIFFILEVLILTYVWNNVIPDVFPNVNKIDFYHAILLIILVNILVPHAIYLDSCKNFNTVSK